VFYVISKIGFGSKRSGTVEFPMTECISLSSPLSPALPMSSTQCAAVACHARIPISSEGIGLLPRDEGGVWFLGCDPQFPMYFVLAAHEHLNPMADRDV
jgi:hypothetical protein